MKKKIIIISSIVLVLLGAGAGYLWHVLSGLEETLKKQLVEQVSTQSRGLYNLEVGKLSIDKDNNTVQLKDLALDYDIKKLYGKTGNHDSELAYLVKGTIDEVKIELYSIRDIDKKGNIAIKHIYINRPNFDVAVIDSVLNAPLQQVMDSTTTSMIYDMFAPYLKKVDIDSLRVTNGNIKMHKKDIAFELHDIRIGVDSLVLDKGMAGDVLSHFSDLSFEAYKFYHLFPDKNNAISFHRISFERKNFMLEIDSLRYQPQYPYDEYITKAKFGRTEAAIPKLKFYNIYIDDFIKTGNLKMDSIEAVNAYIHGYENLTKRINLKKEPLFHTLIQQLPFELEVPIVNIKNAHAVYEEFGVKSVAQRGRTSISNINARIKGLTNMKNSKEKFYHIHADALLFDRARLNLNVDMPIHDDTFKMVGYVGGADLRIVNSMIYPLEFIKIESGTLNGLSFSIVANSTYSKLQMTILYENLKVNVLNSQKTEKDFFASLAANTLFYRNNPMTKNGKVRTVYATVYRDTMRSPFNYLWLTLCDGILQTATSKTVKDFMAQQAAKPVKPKKEVKPLFGTPKKTTKEATPLFGKKTQKTTEPKPLFGKKDPAKEQKKTEPKPLFGTPKKK